MALDEYQRQTWSNQTVMVLLDARRQALRNGASPLKLWDQLEARMLAATRTTDRPSEWATKLLRDLQIESPDKDSSRSISLLVESTTGHAREWLDLVEREHGYMMALARLEAERRRDVRNIVVEEE